MKPNLWMIVAVAAMACLSCAPQLNPVVASASTSLSAATELGRAGFEVLGERNGVTVYRRDASKGLELAAEGDLPGAPSRVLHVLLDYPSHRAWQRRLIECEILSRDASSLNVYERLRLPVIDDRDYTIHVDWGSVGDSWFVRFSTANEKGPAAIAGVVRVAAHEGEWRLVAIAGGRRTHVVYRFHIDLHSPLTETLGRGAAVTEVIHLFGQLDDHLRHSP